MVFSPAHSCQVATYTVHGFLPHSLVSVCNKNRQKDCPIIIGKQVGNLGGQLEKERRQGERRKMKEEEEKQSYREVSRARLPRDWGEGRMGR